VDKPVDNRAFPVDNLVDNLWKTKALPEPVDNCPVIHTLSTGQGQLSTRVIHKPFAVQDGVFAPLSTYPQALLLRLLSFKIFKKRKP
jgi:hypothetical protein